MCLNEEPNSVVLSFGEQNSVILFLLDINQKELNNAQRGNDYRRAVLA